MSQLIKVKAIGEEASEAPSNVPEVESKEQPAQMAMKTDARSGASPAVYA
jgi:hypothetical protein